MKLKNTIKTIFYTCVFYSLLISGLKYGYQGSKNLAVTWTWVLFFCNVICVGMEEVMNNVISKIEETRSFIPPQISLTLSFIPVVIYIWHGFIITGIAAMFNTLVFYHLLYKEPNK